MRDWRYVGDGAFLGLVARRLDWGLDVCRLAGLRRKQNLGAEGSKRHDLDTSGASGEERLENGPGDRFQRRTPEAGRAGRGSVGGGPPRRTRRPHGAGTGGGVGWEGA